MITISKHEEFEKPTLGASLGGLTSRPRIAGINNDEDGVDELSHFGGHTRNDAKDMDRMGKRQQLRRNFRPFSALSFTVVLQATWEFLLISNTQGLVDGGLAGLFWSYVWTTVGFSFIMFSLAEMASMAPTAGGRYHWVSEFAPPKYQKFLSYVAGWMSTLSWQAGTAAGSFLTGTIIQGLIGVNNPDYEPTAWQGTLFVFAMVLVLLFFNVVGSDWIPMLQNFLLLFHTPGFLTVIIVLLVMAPKQSASDVFANPTQSGGWSSMGLALMVGQISAIFGGLSSDATAHIAEECQEGSISVPKAMVWGYIGNGVAGLVILIVYLFSIPSVDDAVNDPSGFPFIYVFSIAVPTSGVNGLTIIVLLLVIFSNISFNLSTSRQTFAFARDNGLPFASWISKVHPTKDVPINAVVLSCACSALLALINLGSTAAFNAIISLQIVAIMFTYCISITCVLYRRNFFPELLPTARWGLGKWGVAINSVSLGYAVFAFFWSFWPNATPVDPVTFNWSVLIFVVVAVLSLAMYFIQGRNVYVGPVTTVEGRRD